MKKAAFLPVIILLFLFSRIAAADSAEIPAVPPAEEIVTHIVLEGVAESAVGDASFIPVPAVDSLPAGENLDCSSKMYYYGAWIIPECNSH